MSDPIQDSNVSNKFLQNSLTWNVIKIPSAILESLHTRRRTDTFGESTRLAFATCHCKRANKLLEVTYCLRPLRSRNCLRWWAVSLSNSFGFTCGVPRRSDTGYPGRQWPIRSERTSLLRGTMYMCPFKTTTQILPHNT